MEGGVNGIAAQDIALRNVGTAPTVIVTGGVGVRKWVSSNGLLRDIMAAADQVEIWAENEVGADGRPDQVKQGRTNDLRQKLASAIAEIRQGAIPSVVYPPRGVKDAAEWNLADALSAGHGHSCA